MPMNKIAIIGAGAWGTALSIALSRKTEVIHLWVYEADVLAQLRATRVNTQYLPGFHLSGNAAPTGNLGDALRHAEVVIVAVPSLYFRAVSQQLRTHLQPGQIVVSASKGLEPTTLLRMSEVLRECCGSDTCPVAVLSGPTF